MLSDSKNNVHLMANQSKRSYRQGGKKERKSFTQCDRSGGGLKNGRKSLEERGKEKRARWVWSGARGARSVGVEIRKQLAVRGEKTRKKGRGEVYGREAHTLEICTQEVTSLGNVTRGPS